MKKLLIRWIILAVSIIIAAKITAAVLNGGFDVQLEGVADFFKVLVGAAALAFINATLGNLLKLLTLPLNCLTLGLVSLVINAIMLLIVGNIGLGFTVTGFFPALVGSVLISLVNGVLGNFVPDDDKSKKED